MSSLLTPKSGNLIPIKSDGTTPAVATDPNDGYALVAATYYIPLGGSDVGICAETWMMSFQVRFNAALAATITLESTDYPAKWEGTTGGRDDVSDIATTTGTWIQENPAGATVYNAGGAGNTVAALTLTAGGTNAGGMIAHLANAGARRYRLKVVVTTPGNLRAAATGKV